MVDDDVEHEAIELGFGKGVRPFQLDRVLRGEHVERLFELIGAALNRDAADCVLGGVRLISSARTMLAKIGPGANTICRRPVVVSSWMMSVPVMSDGIRSGVNWMRENLSSRTRASVWIKSVFASPGTPTMRLFPPTKSDSSTCCTVSA
jgi:hypothetical protein